MTTEHVKGECKVLYEIIQSAQDRLEVIRNICKHENTFEGNYSWRIGSVTTATICSDCGKVISNGLQSIHGS